jgi:hypothetical protein
MVTYQDNDAFIQDYDGQLFVPLIIYYYLLEPPHNLRSARRSPQNADAQINAAGTLLPPLM